MKPWKAEILLLIITFIWGATFSFTKIGLQFASPIYFTFFRFAIALSVSLLIWGKTFFQIQKEHFVNGSILGLFYAGGFILQTLGLNFTTVTKSAFITGLSVAFTPFVYKIVENKKISFNQWLGIGVVLIGLWLFTNPRIDNINIGDVLTLFSTFFWAFYIVYMNKFTYNVTEFRTTIQIVISQFYVVFLASLIGIILFESKPNIEFNQKLIFALIYNGIIATILLTTIHTSIQKYTTPVKAALIFSLEPVFASIFALIIFNEILRTVEYFGAILILIGVSISEFGALVFGKILKKENLSE
ncbi:MAG: DMT family transporter [Ignavibacteria bacterium]|nr:DMT family transporter [Ignavibacteria bacterium]